MDDGFEFELRIIEWPEGLENDLHAAFEGLDVDVVESGAFTGEDVLVLLGKMTKPVVDALAKILIAHKNGKIVFIVKGNRLEVEGFSGDDINAMTPTLLKLIDSLRVE